MTDDADLKAELQRLRSALAVVTRRAVYPSGGWQVCRYCNAFAGRAGDVEHTSECPVTMAKEAGVEG